MIDLQINRAAASEWLLRVGRRQVPFAAAKALTKTAQQAQMKVREGLPQRFTIRNSFVEKGIRIKPARKRNLEAVVYSKDDFMALHETGGVKRPRGQHLALPTDNVKRNQRGIVTRANRPKRQLNKPNVFKGTISGVEGVWKRPGRRSKGSLKLLFAFEPSARIQPRFDFKDTVKVVAQSEITQNFARAFDNALRTAR